jgi:hypothetical protein
VIPPLVVSGCVSPPSQLARVPSDPTKEKTMLPVAGAPPVFTVAVKVTGSPVTSPVGTELDSVTEAGLLMFCPELFAFPFPEPLPVGVGFDEGVDVGAIALLPAWTFLDSVPTLGA